MYLSLKCVAGFRSMFSAALLAVIGVLVLSGGSRSSLMAQDKPSNLEGHTDAVYGVVYSPDGQLIATASFDKTIKIWKAADGKEVRTLQGHQDLVLSLATTPDGKRLLSSSLDNNIMVWEWPVLGATKNFAGHGDAATSVSNSPDGKLVVAGGNDKTVKIFNFADGNCLLYTSPSPRDLSTSRMPSSA